MLDQQKILDKLYNLSHIFRSHYKNKKYAQAKKCYDTAITVAVFCEISELDRIKLFGNRPYKEDEEELEEGLFCEEEVQKAYWECIKQNQTREYETFKRIKK